MDIEDSKSRGGRTFVNTPVFHPIRRKSRVRRPKWRIVRNPGGHFRDGPAPNWVVAGQLFERAVKADVLNRDVILRLTKTVIKVQERIEDCAIFDMIIDVRAIVDCSLENRVLGSIPTVREVGIAGVPFGVTSR